MPRPTDELIEDFIERQAGRMDLLLRKAAYGDFTVEEWFEEMTDLLEDVELGAQQLARREARAQGLKVPRRLDREAVATRVQEQQAYLTRFTEDIRRGAYAGEPSLPSLLARARLYATSGHVAYERFKTGFYQLAGYTMKRRVLNAKESCVDCQREAGYGWVPINDPSVGIPGDGNTACKMNCKCHLEYM